MPSDPKANMQDMNLPLTQCPYCHYPMNRHNATEEHIIPTSREGSNVKENKIYACGTCNMLLKSDTLYGEQRLSDKTKPDTLGRLYIPDKDIRKAYIAGIRSELLKLLNSDEEVA